MVKYIYANTKQNRTKHIAADIKEKNDTRGIDSLPSEP